MFIFSSGSMQDYHYIYLTILALIKPACYFYEIYQFQIH